MLKVKVILLFCGVLSLMACKKEGTTGENLPNVLLIIADDLGKDATNGFEEGNRKPTTPNIDAIKDNGISFNNFWVYPTCSPTRSSIITGKYGYRTNVKWASDELVPSDKILQKYIKDQKSYSTAIVGKWHLSGNDVVNPEDWGIDYYAGLLGGGVQDYSNWILTEDGDQSNQTNYITEHFTDLAMEWVNAQDKPWFLWLAYTSPHTPFHLPPQEMHQQGVLPEYTQGKNPMPYYLAMIEAMDFQIGRLLNEIPQSELDNTVILFMGDNGPPNQVAQSPYTSSKAKGSLYQGGINTPLFVSGKDVVRKGVSDSNLINSTDLFATIVSLCGVETTKVRDSESFAHLFSSEGEHRKYQYSEMDSGTDDLWTISDGMYKLITGNSGAKELYNLVEDPYEDIDLMLSGLTSQAQMHLSNLEQELSKIRN